MTKLVNKVLFVNNRRTSMRLCLKEWEVLSEICKMEKISRNTLIERIENNRNCHLGLTYLTRLFIIAYYHNLAHKVKALPDPIMINDVLDELKERSLAKKI